MQKIMNQAELARYLGVAVTTVRKHLRAGTIPHHRNAHDQISINVKDAIKAWREHVNPEWEPAKGFQLEQAVKAHAGEDPGKKPTEGTKAYADWRRDKEKWASKKAEIEYKFKAGELVEANKVKRIAFETGKITRENLLALPDRLSHEFAAELDPKKISIRLEEELTKALEEIHNVPEKLKKLTEEILKRKRNNDKVDDDE
jgi:hypothetical protein